MRLKDRLTVGQNSGLVMVVRYDELMVGSLGSGLGAALGLFW
jgi:hypothetical protein